MTKFKSIWGDLDVANVSPVSKEPVTTVDTATKPPAPDPIDDEDAGADVEDSVDEVVETKAPAPEGPPPVKPEEPAKKVEYSEEDITKAYNILMDEGVLDIDEEKEEFDVSPQGLGDAIAATVRNKLQAEIAAIPPVVQQFYAHVMEGNDPSSFKITAPIIWSEVAATDEENQKAALLQFYRGQGMSEEDAKEELSDVVESGKLEKKAEIAFNTLIASQEKQLEAQKAARTAAEKQAEADRAKEIKEIESTIDSADEYAGFKLDAPKKQAFKDYLFKINPRTGKTQMQMNMADEKRRLTVAFLDFVNYTKEDMEKDVKTKLTSDRKKKLSRYTDKSVTNQNASASVKTKVNDGTGKIKFPTIFGNQTIEVED